ncbi:uncharacterized protein LOC113238620 [Hyposmocoma kahamanoa]|uniref:uncharacterized protein LOC113238620 n=1 Tax=Hyposmocoma kahamanoa TaxID=1477025 RepID=UPI000E6D9F1D|nr:uncharacterized protein LOC113238620 [Hyposmocoma kahamanoa]
MGSARGGARPPSHTAYFVALAGILILLLMLCCYFFYFCIKRVKELSRETASTQAVTAASPAVTTYPVQPGVRDSATAMAKLCKQIPQTGGKGDTVFPTSTSPGATQTDTGTETRAAELPKKLTAPAVGVNVCEAPVVR